MRPQHGPRYSSSFAGLLAPVLAGVAVTAAPAVDLPPPLRPTRRKEGLPELPEASLLLLKARNPRQPATDALAARILESFGVKGSIA
jgi:hypothetical protein